MFVWNTQILTLIAKILLSRACIQDVSLTWFSGHSLAWIVLNCQSALHFKTQPQFCVSVRQSEFQRKPNPAVKCIFKLGASRRVLTHGLLERDCDYLLCPGLNRSSFISFTYFIHLQALIFHPVEEAGVSHLAWLHCGWIPDLAIHHLTHINNTWEPKGQWAMQTPFSPFQLIKLCLIRFLITNGTGFSLTGTIQVLVGPLLWNLKLKSRLFSPTTACWKHLLWINTVSLHIKHDKQEFTPRDKTSFPCCFTVVWE